MRVLTHPKLDLKLPSFGIDVPLLDQRVERIVRHLGLKAFDLSVLEEITEADVLNVHSREYAQGLWSEKLSSLLSLAYEREAQFRDLKHAQELRSIILNQTSTTHLALKTALEDQDETFFLGGGMHHAHFDFGHGFCLINDIVIALEKERRRGRLQTAWVIDTDAHFGDGTAALSSSRDWLTSFSIHQAYGWPLAEGEQKIIPSSLDIAIEPNEEKHYLSRLETGLLTLEKKFDVPDVVMVVAGADAFEGDILPSSSDLRLSLEQMLQRDQMVYNFFKQRGVPQAWVMAGGYGSEVWRVWAQFLSWVGATTS